MTVTYDFSGQVGLVTGASAGTGAATVWNFAGSGASVVLADRIPGAIRSGHPDNDPDVLAGKLWDLHTNRDTFRTFAQEMDTDD